MSLQGDAAIEHKRLLEPERASDSEEAGDAHTKRYASRTCSLSARIVQTTLSFAAGFSLAASLFWGGNSIPKSTSYETGFATDIASLRPAIGLVEQRFSGTLRFKDTDHLYIDLGSEVVRYFGAPSPEVDEAWGELIGDHEGAFPDDILVPDVLHTLHCINEVRKVLDSPYYYNRTLESLNRGRRIHIDHCLNHIRQSVQCHVDLTPVRTLYFKDMNTEVGDFDQVHTCRDIGKLKRWMNERNVASKDTPQRNSDGKFHLLGYPPNEESLLPWDNREREFD